jgi:hypothetical protein
MFQFKLQYEYSTTLILYKNDSDALKLVFRKVIWVFHHFCFITTHKFVQINVTTPNYLYYKIYQLKHLIRTIDDTNIA